MNALSHVRLLMVEDSKLDYELIASHLRRAQLDFSATVVDEEKTFRSMLETTDPDVILSDYNLPRFDGISALRIARVVAPSKPFIFVSGSIGEERAVEALREGATDYVLKDRMSRLAPAILRAITERRERMLRQSMETALSLSEQRFQYAAAATREIIWDWNLATSRIWYSDALRDFWGYELPMNEGPSDWFEERIHPGDRERVRASLLAALPSAERWATEFRFARADDTYSDVFVRALVMRNDRGEATRVIGAMLDVSERLSLEAQLQQVRRVESLGRVAATIAHEFNNVLMGIQPIAEIMRRRAKDEESEHLAKQILSSVSRGQRVTTQILRFASPAEPALHPVKLRDWLEQAAPELKALAGPAIDFRLQVDDGDACVSMDAGQMQQVLANLVVNARDSMPKGGTLTIRTAREAGTVLLCVIDSGTGIPLGVLEQIFEPLFTTKRNGTGLGLAVAQQVVARHGGSLNVSSTAGEGTTFRILLPETSIDAGKSSGSTA
jgi:signal transduction histidine kinase